MHGGFVLRVVGGPAAGTVTQLDEAVLVGREGDLVVGDKALSRRHARIEASGDGIGLTDLGSSTGTFVNGRRVDTAVLEPGDRIRMGRSEFLVLRLERFSDAAAGPALLIDAGGRRRLVSVGAGVVVGRDEDADVCVANSTVSRRHARVTVTGSGAEIEDLDSSNGTRVNGRRIRGAAPLSDGTTIEFGRAPTTATFVEGADVGEIPLRVRIEGRTDETVVSVDAAASATVAEVTAELAFVLGAPDAGLLAYRSEDGALLHPDDRWYSTGTTRGDLVVLGVGDASGLEPAPSRRFAPRRQAVVNQLPRTVWPDGAFPAPRVDVPDSTSFKGRGILWQILGGVGSILVGLTLVVIRPDYWAFGLITGAVGVISISVSILSDQSRRRAKVSTFRQRLRELDRDLSGACERQAATRRSLSPDLEELETRVRNVSTRLWERRPVDPDALRLRMGVGTIAAAIDRERTTDSDSPLQRELDAVFAEHADLIDVPVWAPGPETGALGVTGDAPTVHALLARMVLEAAVVHPPDQLRIWVAASDPSWQWARWLPHIATPGPSADAGSASEVVAAAALDIEDGSDVLHLVVVPDITRRVDVGGLLSGGARRTVTVVGATDQRDLPSGLGVVVDIDADGTGEVVGSYPGAPNGTITVDGVDDVTAQRLAVELGRLGTGTTTTRVEGLVELLGLGSATTVDVAASWNDPPSEPLTVAVGSDDGGAPVTIGFRRDGPHGMVAGTTGSGKSEFLQTVLAALTLRHDPTALNLFLIDFKGGAGFAPFAPLPHVVGMVTDLERHDALAARAFTALDAQIEQRKRVLDDAGVADVHALARSGGPRLPDLLVVIDEFALLVERRPDVKDRLDTVATQGRSLGIHLLLATQSPSGVITHAIRTNTNLWVCLRVVTDSESMEIIGTRDAARIPDGSPGRAIIRLGASQDLRPFQAARVARPVPDEDTPVRVSIAGRGGGTSSTPTGASTTTELDVVVARMVDAARTLRLPDPDPLWLPPLPEHLPRAALPGRTGPDERLRVVLGVADLPRRLRQEPCTVDLSSSGHLLVTGMLGAGKSSTLRHVVTDLAATRAPGDVHIYGIDAGAGALGSLVELPHVGDVVGAHDTERTTRLVDRLAAEVAARRDLLAVSGSGDFVRWRAAGGDRPWIVLVVDDYPALRETAEQVENGRLLERFHSLLQSGPPVGIHLVIGTPQAVDLRTREVNLMPTRLVLRSADVADYALVDARFAAADAPELPPGRGFTNGAVEVQVCAVDDDELTQITRRWEPLDVAVLARPVLRLPPSVGYRDLGAAGRPDAFALGGTDVGPLSVDFDVASPAILVAGPRQSGRSTALLALLRAAGPLEPGAPHLVIAPRPGPLRAWATDHGAELVERPEDMVDALERFAAAATSGSTIVIDDGETLAGVPGVADRLDRIVRTAGDRGIRVCAAVRVSDLPGLFDPWARYLVSLRRAVLLQPTGDDAFLFGAKLPTVPPPMTAGRGVLVHGSDVIVLQVAHSGPDGTSDGGGSGP